MSEALPGLLYLLRVSMYVAIIVFAKEILANVKHWIPVALWMFLTVGLFQYVFLPDTRFLLHSGWDEHYYRLIGSMLDPNYIGAMLGVLGLFGMFEYSAKKKRRWLFFAMSSFVALVLTFSRASWLATILGGVVFVLRSKKGLGKLAVLGIMGIIGFYIITPKPGGEGVRLTRTASVFERLVSWQNAIKIWQYHPLIGVGFNNYRAASMKYGILNDPSSHAANAPSSSWLLLGATLGVLGVLGGLLRAMRPFAQEPMWSAIAVVIGVHAMFNNTLFFVPLLALLAILRSVSQTTSDVVKRS